MANMLDRQLRHNIRFTYNEALEFIVAMGMVACGEQMDAMAQDYKIEIDSMANAFYADADVRLSPHTLRELKFFFGHNFLHKTLDFGFYVSICSNPEPQNAEDWIASLEAVPAEWMLTEMVFGVYHDKLEELLQGRDWEALKGDLGLLAALVKDTPPHVEVLQTQEPLLECLAHPEECKLRYMQLLRQFYKDVFIHWKKQLQEHSEQASAHYEAVFAAKPEQFIREIHKNEPDIFTSVPTAFHVSQASQVGNHFLIFTTEAGNVGWVIFGIHNERVFGPAADREQTELFLKAFSDKRRLDFVLLLKERPHYGQEIASALGITPAAVNYHSNFLFFLDLISVKREDHRLYYHLNVERLRDLLALTAKIMLD
ncbi:ArsR/SmtB family transcription factor [Paenibacillus camerounensis]|uniref:ArsR/SmtB family transcription factor n=1 Tax=Paenibacillus camerounensis TaxID=1243663 RepID=UPI0005AACED6|nr:winged helix-turn-helix transcriptional regulator [Paenibacillus camerounensis]